MMTWVLIKSFVMTRWVYVFSDRKKLERFQLRKITQYVAFLKDKSPFFAQLSCVRSLADVHTLPLMNKAIMMQYFNEMNTLSIDKDQALQIAIDSEKTRNFTPKYQGVSVGLSSGTSGHRGLFIVSDKERSAWAGAVLAKFLPKGRLFGHRIAFFLRANNNLYETVGSSLIKFTYFDIYEDIDSNMQKLVACNPTILVAPPSILLDIARRKKSGEITLTPQKIISVAEVLTARDEKIIREAFGVSVVFQAYQCTEGFLAHTCEFGMLHLNEDIVYIEKEFLDERRFVPIVTDFRRTSQPIVRYRLNDVLVLSDVSCRCKSAMTALSHIEGREDDIFLCKKRDNTIVQVYPDMIGRCMLYVEGFQEYKVSQVGYERLVIELDVKTADIMRRIEDELSGLAHKLSLKPFVLSFKKYTPDRTRKMKRIERVCIDE